MHQVQPPSLPPQAFLTRTLKESVWGPAITHILAAAIQAVKPGHAVSKFMQRRGSQLIFSQGSLESSYDLDQLGHVWVAAIGKASLPMASTAANILGKNLSGGIVVTKKGFRKQILRSENSNSQAQPENRESTIEPPSCDFSLPACLEMLEAGHPVPNSSSLDAALAVRKLLDKTGEKDLVLGLISGGGSALMASPAFGISLDELQVLTERLLESGASIQEINILRKHLEELKGGRMAQLAAPANLVCLVLSDVIGDPLDMIASGPCVADTSYYADAYQVLERYRLTDLVHPSILETLQNGMQGVLPETPKPGDPIFNKVQSYIIGNNIQSAQAALNQAQAEGFQTLLLQSHFEGEASQVGKDLVAFLEKNTVHNNRISRPFCIITGGETTVNLHGSGKGGRNQELALATVKAMSNLKDVLLISLATDGEDGPTDAAGAVVSNNTLREAAELGLDPDQYLADNDAYNFFAPLGDLVRCGPTHTNVNDLVMMFAL